MTEEPKKFYGRCGLCNENFATKSGMDAHFRSEKHNRRLTRWYEFNTEQRREGLFEDINGNAKEVLAEEKRPEVVSFD